MSITLTPNERVSLAVTNAANCGLYQEFVVSMLIYLVEHSSAELVDQAIADASLEWDL